MPATLGRRIDLIGLEYGFDDSGIAVVTAREVRTVWADLLADDQVYVNQVPEVGQVARRDRRWLIRYRRDVLEAPSTGQRWYLDSGGFVYFVTDAAEDADRGRRRFVILRAGGGAEPRADFDKRTELPLADNILTWRGAPLEWRGQLLSWR